MGLNRRIDTDCAWQSQEFVMSAMQFGCPFCSSLFEVMPEWVGQQVACPTCGGVVLVPALNLGTETPPSPQSQQQPPAAPPPVSATGSSEWSMPPASSVMTTGTPLSRPLPIGEEAKSRPVPLSTGELDFEEAVLREQSLRHYLSPEERAYRRAARQVIWGILGLIVLVIMAVILFRSQ